MLKIFSAISQQQVVNNSNSPASIQFLFTELQTGLMFADLALSVKPYETDKIQADTANARNSYESFLKFRERVELSEAQRRALNAALEKLKSALRALGEPVQ